MTVKIKIIDSLAVDYIKENYDLIIQVGSMFDAEPVDEELDLFYTVNTQGMNVIFYAWEVEVV